MNHTQWIREDKFALSPLGSVCLPSANPTIVLQRIGDKPIYLFLLYRFSRASLLVSQLKTLGAHMAYSLLIIVKKLRYNDGEAGRTFENYRKVTQRVKFGSCLPMGGHPSSTDCATKFAGKHAFKEYNNTSRSTSSKKEGSACYYTHSSFFTHIRVDMQLLSIIAS